jgi:hypothetical protein
MAGTQAFVLTGWKEIAEYLGLGVRTVQRYERSFLLPIHRLGGKSHAAVVAFPEDLKAWLRHASLDEGRFQTSGTFREQYVLQAHQREIASLRSNLLRLSEQIAEGQRILVNFDPPGTRRELNHVAGSPPIQRPAANRQTSDTPLSRGPLPKQAPAAQNGRGKTRRVKR